MFRFLLLISCLLSGPAAFSQQSKLLELQIGLQRPWLVDAPAKDVDPNPLYRYDNVRSGFGLEFGLRRRANPEARIDFSTGLSAAFTSIRFDRHLEYRVPELSTPLYTASGTVRSERMDLALSLSLIARLTRRLTLEPEVRGTLHALDGSQWNYTETFFYYLNPDPVGPKYLPSIPPSVKKELDDYELPRTSWTLGLNGAYRINSVWAVFASLRLNMTRFDERPPYREQQLVLGVRRSVRFKLKTVR